MSEGERSIGKRTVGKSSIDKGFRGKKPEGKAIDQGFAPLLGKCPKVLILGTLPSVKSLQEQQYYGHPQNAFWWLMSQMCGFEPGLSYSERVSHLLANHIAVWDVIQSCHRPGSLDSKIDQSTLETNDFLSLLGETSTIKAIAFNGQSASKLFSKFVDAEKWKGDFIVLPSTSPANASMRKETKLEKWLSLKDYL